MDVKCSTRDSPLPPLQKTALRIYSNRFCPYAMRAMLVLEHKNLPYEAVNIHLKNKPSWYTEKNPLSKVPVIEKGDQIIYESTAVCEWLDEVYPYNRLTPTDPYIRARDRILLEYIGKITSLYYGKLKKKETLEEGITELQKHYQFFEDELARREGPLFGGSNPAMIDFFIWPFFERLPGLAKRDERIAVNQTAFPRLAKWYSAMYAVPAVKAIAFDADTHAAFLKTVDEGTPNFDLGL
ncbi:glutathione S-transferase omega-1-like [Aplysia californica]|uniref:Glutathione S-transferase omega n=1 Tax=Aplysia californica TaxID=6500 RepID=A0ABM0K0M8_APLCA|nr:glutathione S-transferase omega-1-like [Aplysia californica]